MDVYRHPDLYERKPFTVATIGTFDGVHLGHQVILRRVIALARASGGTSLLITFHPHPRQILFPDRPPVAMLHTLEEKIAALEALGLDQLLVLPFTRAFSETPSEVFIREVLAGTVGVKRLVIGYDHRFGRGRSGGLDELRSFSAELGYEVEEIPAQTIDDAEISSTRIRQALNSGDPATAARYLGYPYVLAGEVVHGEKQGRLLGYPTANIQPEDPHKLVPADGVYLCRAQVRGETLYGLMSIGRKPTLGDFERTCEIYLLDFSGDLYGARLQAEFLEYLRPQRKFSSLEALIEAMGQDKAYAQARVRALRAQAAD